MSLLELALGYAQAGYPVFPLDPRGKQPLGRLVPHGLKNASTDPEQIRRWWEQEPEANIGICTGAVFDVADLDGEEAVERFAAILREHGQDPRLFPRARTGGGGRHLFMAPTGIGNRARVLPGVDWRGKGGYIVAPGSVHPTGGSYQWLSRPNGSGFPDAPDWLVGLLRPAQKTAEPGREPAGPAPENYVRRALDAEIEAVRLALEGERNDRLNRAAFSLGQLVGAGWLSKGLAEAELRAAALRCGLSEPEVSLTIRSGLSSGESEPRQGPAQGWSADQKRGEIRHGGKVGEPEAEADEEELRSSWEPVDLQKVMAGDLSPLEPVRLPRTDGVRLLYPGRVHMFLGEPESCKSWAAQIAIAEILIHGEHAVYIDFEAEARDVVTHLQALGVPDDVILYGLSYVRPEEPFTAAARKSLIAHLEEVQSKMTVLDGINAALIADGLDPNSNKDVGRWWRELIRPLQRGTDGPTALIDHVAKSKENRGDWSVGAGQKKALIDGAMIAFEVIDPFGRGLTGVIKLLLFKDRPGYLRGQQGSNKEIARLRLSSAEDGSVGVDLTPPPAAAKATTEDGKATPEKAPWRPTGYMERVSRKLEDSPEPLTQNAIEIRVMGRARYVRGALEALISEGYVEVAEGPNRSRLHRSLKPFREEEPQVRPEYVPVRPEVAGDAPGTGASSSGSAPPYGGRPMLGHTGAVVQDPPAAPSEAGRTGRTEALVCPRCGGEEYEPLGNGRRRCLTKRCGREW